MKKFIKDKFNFCSFIAKIEKGEVDLAESKIREFAKALKVSPQELMGWEERTESSTTAAHKDGENFTPEELNKIEEYKKLLVAARPKE
mgnify:CR=1 FL=1